MEIIERSLKVETHLIDDLLDVTALTRGKIKVQFKPHDVHEILRYAVEVVQSEIDQRKLQVIMFLDAKQSIVSTDFARLAQVLWNLTRNAVKFTPPGGTVTISTVNEGNKIRVGIGDTGMGIAKADLEGIFDAFEQCAATAKSTH